MTTIHEKIMGLDPHEPTFYYCGYSDGLKKAANIAEAEVARLETRMRELEQHYPKELLLNFAKNILSKWSVDKYWDGEICESCTDPERLVNEFLASNRR